MINKLRVWLTMLGFHALSKKQKDCANEYWEARTFEERKAAFFKMKALGFPINGYGEMD